MVFHGGRMGKTARKVKSPKASSRIMASSRPSTAGGAVMGNENEMDAAMYNYDHRVLFKSPLCGNTTIFFVL